MCYGTSMASKVDFDVVFGSDTSHSSVVSLSSTTIDICLLNLQ